MNPHPRFGHIAGFRTLVFCGLFIKLLFVASTIISNGHQINSFAIFLRI